MDTKSFGQRIRTARKNKKNMTSEKLAEMVDVDPKTIVLIENGHRSVSLTLFIKLCNALTVSPEFLLGEELLPGLSKYCNDQFIEFLLVSTEKERELLLSIGETIIRNRGSFEIK